MVVSTGQQFCDPAGENSWSMGYEVWVMGYGLWGIRYGLWSMRGRQYGACEFISDPLFLNLVLAHKTFHTTHVWKYKGLFTSNSLQCALKRIRIECASNADSIRFGTFHITKMQCALSIYNYAIRPVRYIESNSVSTWRCPWLL